MADAQDRSSAAALLGRLPLFQDVAESTVADLARRAAPRTLSRGEELFGAREPSNAMYVLMTGRIRIWIVSAGGSEVTLNIVTGGGLFGEIGLLDGGERTAAASAAEKSDVLSIDRASFFAAMEADPQLARNAIAFLCERLRWVSARLEDSALRTAPERLARLLEHLADDHGKAVRDDDAEGGEAVSLSVKLSQGELARWSLMSRESANKILARWSDEGLIRQDKGWITVLDMQRLRDFAEFGDDG